MTKLSHSYRLAAEAHRLSIPEMLDAHRHQRPFTRFGQIALGEALHVLSFNSFITQFGGYRFLDSGWEAVVLESEDESQVMKILLRTATFNQKRAKDNSLAYQSTSDIGRNFLGDQWLETTFYPQPMRTFPLMLQGFAVVAMQKRVHPIISFPSPESLVEERNLAKTAPELKRMTTNIRNMYERSSMYPDIRGGHNIVLVKESGQYKLKIIDTTLPQDKSHFQKNIPEKGKNIGEAISEKLLAWERVLAQAPLEWFESQVLAVN